MAASRLPTMRTRSPIARLACTALAGSLLLAPGDGAVAESFVADPFPVPERPARSAAPSLHADPVMSPMPGASFAPLVIRSGRYVLHVPVLMYHRISPAPRDALLPDLWISPRRFREQLTALQRAGWRTVTAADLASHLDAHERLPARTFVITVDDGARDGFTNAVPVLRDLGMVATFCVNPGRTGRRWTMTWEMLRAMQREGHEIAQHSLTHADLPALGDRALRHQLQDAQQLVRTRLGAAPTTLCYPFGHHSARVRGAVARSGIRLAFTTAWGAREDTADRYRAPRIRVSPGNSGAELVRRLAPYR